MLLDTIRSAIHTGDVIDLAHPLMAEMPHHPAHAPYMYRLTKKHGDVMYEDGVSASNDMCSMGMHIGTHIDALAHIAKDGMVHGGHRAEDCQSVLGGHRLIGIDTVAPIVGRGVLLDIARLRGVDCLQAGCPVTAQDMEDACRMQNITIGQGDCVLIRTGWQRHWHDEKRFISLADGAPGPDIGGALWLAERGIRCSGTDTSGYEMLPAPGLPVHVEFLVRRGIHIMECLNLTELALRAPREFLFVASPLKIVGGTGSPIRPIAIC